jgi:Glutamate decarboxylase and related PLP-dependent proteins
VNPFLYPDYKWDFRLPRVQSINASGHKYGLVPPGLGWIVFKDRMVFNEDLVFYVNYLGGEAPTATLNFSKGSSTVLMQYYMFLRLGRDGYAGYEVCIGSRRVPAGSADQNRKVPDHE